VGRRFAALAAAALALVLAPAAAASGPPLRVPQAELEKGLKCPIGPLAHTKKTPVMFVTGTGVSGDTAWLLVADAFAALGHPTCYVNFPANTTADIQVSVEYLVHGLRRQYELAGRKIAVIGISQGGLLPRFALTYWPDLRRKVGDFVAVAGTQHGTNLFSCSAAAPCEPAAWQQVAGSNLLRALNSQPDETPGRVSYTTVRSLTDETVQPQTGKRPTSSLRGARNIAIQDICPGRATTHVGAIVDSVTFAAFYDAIARPGKGKAGAADTSAFPPDVCSHPYGPGLNDLKTSLFLGVADVVVDAPISLGPSSTALPAEPPVRKVFKRKRR